MSEDHKGLWIRVHEDVFHNGKLEIIDEVFRDFSWNGSKPDMAELKQYVVGLRTTFPDLRMTVEDTVAEGDMVAFRTRFSGTHESEHMGIPATGKRVVWRSMIFSRIIGGKILEEWNVSDLQSKLREAADK